MSEVHQRARTTDRPRNGIAGLRHWKQDAMAGLMVSLTSLPLSLGIAVASGAPPIAGLVSAIIAGLICPLIGGPYVTISGPAAGLAPALFATMLALGKGDLDKGYPLLLAVICIVGAVQVVLSFLGAARLSSAFPVAVVEGTLASIGLMIVAKEMPHLIGHDFKSHAFFGILQEVPSEIRVMDPASFGVGLVCLLLMFFLSSQRVRTFVKFPLPAPLVVVIVGMIMGAVLGIDDHHRIHIPDDILMHGIVMPHFTGLFSDPSIRGAAIAGVVTLVLIDGVESLATIKAIDKIDPYKRKSDPDRTLLAMGIANSASSLAGGLTIIPGGVRSKLCIVSGGRTLWADTYNAICLIIFLLFGKGLINQIPYSALAAILMYTGFRMFEPAVWRHVARVGSEQLLLFTATVLVTLSTDLLVGIFVGMCLKLLMSLMFTSRHVWDRDGRPMGFGSALRYAVGHVSQMFRNPVVGREEHDGEYHLRLDRPLVCFNSIFLDRELAAVPSTATGVVLHVGPNVAMIDHTSCDTLLHFAEEFEHSGRGKVEVEGLDQMRKRSAAQTSMRLAPVRVSVAAAVPAPLPTGPTDSLSDLQPSD